MGALSEHLALYVARAMPFLDWWAAELRQIFLPLLRHLDTGKAVARIALHDDHVDLWTRPASAASDEPARHLAIPASFFALDESQSDALRSLTAGAEVAIALPANEICVLSLRPLGTAPPTRESVRYRLLLESPIDVERVAFAWRFDKTGMPGDADSVCLRVALCRKEYLDRVGETAKRYGWPSPSMGSRWDDGDEHDFAFPRQRSKNVALSIKANLNSILLFGALSLPVVVTILVGTVAMIDLRLDAQALDSRRSQLQASEVVMRRQAAADAIHATLKREGALPSITNALNELSRLLPENTWLAELRLEGRNLHITGLSADPAAAAKAVAPSRRLGDVRLVSVSSPTTSTAAQFEMTATLADTP